MKTLILILALAATAMTESNVQDILKKGNDLFTAKFLNEVWKNKRQKSFVLSAFSVLSPLAQLGLASVGDSHDEILTAIGMPNDEVTKEVFSDINNKVRSVKGVELKQANKVYVRTGYTLNDDFADVSKSVFNSEVQNINFDNAQGSADEINLWVEDKTNKRIKNLVDPSTLTKDTAAVLVNAIYFKGDWQIPFEKYSTRERNFFANKNETVTLPMMHQSDRFKYGESRDLDAKLLEMAYEGGETSFVIVLPNSVFAISALVDKLKDPEAFTKARSSMYVTDVHVAIPKFKIETTTDLGEILQKMNIKKLFNEREAHLDKMIKGESNLYVSDAIQKAFIEVDETGTEAAAANKFGVAVATSLIQTFYQSFEADHPFAFYLMHQDNILFNGIYGS